MDLLLSPVQQKRFKDRIEQSINLKKLYQGIDSIPALTGAGVRFIDSEFNIVELRPFERICLRDPVYIVLREPPTAFNADQFASYLRQNQENPRENKLVKEVAGAVLSCGAAALGWIVVFSSAAAIPVSGGASSAITYLSLGAALASTAQCANGLYRSKEEYQGNGAHLDALDSQEWYQNVSSALDIISIAGAGAAFASAIKSIKLFKASTGRSYADILKGLSRAEKRRLTLEVIRVNNPGVSNHVLKRMIRNGQYPKRYTSSGIRNTYALQVKDAVGASLSFTGSALSGTIGNIAVGIWEEIDE